MRTRNQSPSSDALLGKVILSFRIERKLAEGGMGAVYLARHEELVHTLKVIKVLLPDCAAEPALRGRFRREAEAASRLKHDKILGVDNFGTLEDDQLFMMVPFLEGEPLDAFLHKHGGRLAPHCVLHLAVQICDALDYAHGCGVIHRDLNPGTVFVVSTNDNPYVTKLLDFGIAKVLGTRELGPRTHSPDYSCVDALVPEAGWSKVDGHQRQLRGAAEAGSFSSIAHEVSSPRVNARDRAKLRLPQQSYGPPPHRSACGQLCHPAGPWTSRLAISNHSVCQGWLELR